MQEVMDYLGAGETEMETTQRTSVRLIGASEGASRSRSRQQQTSLGAIDPNKYATKEYVDGKIADLDFPEVGDIEYTYISTATPSTTPVNLTGDKKVFYIATEEGDYANFGLVNINELSIIKSDNGRWKSEGLGVPFGISEVLNGEETEVFVKIAHNDIKVSTYFNLGTTTPSSFPWNTSASTSTAITDLTTFRTEIPANTKFYVRGEGKASPRQRMFIIGAEDGTVLADSINFYQNCNRDDLFGPYQFDVKCKVFMQVLSPYNDSLDGVFTKEVIAGEGLLSRVNKLEDNINSNNSIFKGKTLVSIGDSLSTGGIWQQRFCDLTGALFDNTINKHNQYPTSSGGTSMYGNKLDMGLLRVKNIERHGIVPDIIVLENVNDKSAWSPSGTPIPDKCGSIEDASYIVNNVIDNGALMSDWASNPKNILSSIPASNRQLGTMLLLSSLKNGKNIAITTLPTSAGTFTINLKYGGLDYTYGITVAAGESRESILDKILEYDYPLISDTLADDGLSIDFCEEAGTNNLRILYDAGNTGIVLNITDTSNAKSKSGIFYDAESIDEWEDSSKWIDTIPLYRAWKGIVEYCAKTYPNATICIMALISRSGDIPDDYLNTDGTYNQLAYRDTLKRQEELVKALKEIAEMYSVQFIDVGHNDGVNIANLNTYYPTPNAHPYDNLYKRWGEILANKLS
jgi:hypothetical protein